MTVNASTSTGNLFPSMNKVHYFAMYFFPPVHFGWQQFDLSTFHLFGGGLKAGSWRLMEPWCVCVRTYMEKTRWMNPIGVQPW